MRSLLAPSVRRLALVIASSFACATLSPGVSSAELTAVSSEMGDSVLQEMGEYFDAHPELKTQPGSGWKPYNRMRWARDRRVGEGRMPANDALWKAWEHKRAIEQARGPSEAWFSLGPSNFGGRMLALDFDPSNTNVVYAGAAGGGVFKSTDGGASWLPVTDDIPSMGVGGVAVSRTNSNIVVIGTGEPTFNIDRITGVGILRSTDAGATWQLTDLTYEQADGHGFHVVTAGASGVFLAGAVDGIYRSTDDGATWTEVMGTVTGSFINGWYDIQYDPENSSRVYAVKGNDAADNGVYVSEDDGVTWNVVGVGQPPSSAFGKSKLAVSGSTVYCYIGDAGFGGDVWGLLKSKDDGATWTAATATDLPTNQSWYNLACVADPDFSERVLCAAVRLKRSDDGGETFTRVDTLVTAQRAFRGQPARVHVDHHALLYEPGSSSRVWVLNDGGVYSSNDDGSPNTWLNLNDGLVTYQFYDICVNNGPDPYYVMGGTQDNGTDKWSGTTTWADGLGADGMVCNIDPTNGTTVYAEIQFGDHRKSTTSGTDFFEINDGIDGTGRWVTPVDVDQRNGNRLFTETSSGIFRSVDGGASWTEVAPHRAAWISISPAFPNIVWSVVGISGHRSIDGGNSWAPFSNYGFSVGSVTKIIAHPTDAGTAFVTFSTFSNQAKVARTTDGGQSWENVTGDLPDIPVNGIAINPSATTGWYIATDLGVWFTTNSGVNWEPYGTGLPNTVVDDVEIKDSLQRLVAGTHGRGAWEVALAEIVSTAEVPDPRPRNMLLDEPFPNPAGDRVLFRFAAHSDAAVSLKIFDVRGRLVANLENLSVGDGIIRTTPWLTKGVTSGLYFAVLRAGDNQLTRKVMVQR